MSSRWPHGPAGTKPSDRAGTGGEPYRPHGVDVPERSAHLLDGMSDYGD